MEHGRNLSEVLFGTLSPRVKAKSAWILAPDGPLFEVPVAALPVSQRSNRFIGDQHSLRTLPGAWIRQTPRVAHSADGFAGVGDALYNAADPRWRGRPLRASDAELPRVPGTGRELQACAAAWKRDQKPVLLTGEAVSSEGVRELLRCRPAVLHIAGHVIPHPTIPEQVMVALGLRPTGDLDVLGAVEISSG